MVAGSESNHRAADPYGDDVHAFAKREFHTRQLFCWSFGNRMSATRVNLSAGALVTEVA